MGLLDGRVIIISGAGRGIGAALARVMAAEGASVVVNDPGVNLDGTGLDNGPADQVVAQIKAAGGSAVPNYDSVADHRAAENIVTTALQQFGRLDVVVHTAGILRDRMIFNMSEDEWDAVINVHLKGAFNLAKFAAIYWRQAREGHYRLINFTSESGLYGAPGQPNYAAAKMGIVGLTLSCANALRRYGVTANCIAPRAATRMTATVPPDRGGDIQNVGDPRTAPENVAPPVVYLASTRSDWLNGRVIGVHGFEISLFSNPTVVARLVSPQPWDFSVAAHEMERTFHTAIEGIDPSVKKSLGYD